MKPKQLCSVLAAVILGGILLSPTAHAQYTGDFQTNIISGVEVDWTGTYAVGSNTAYDFLGIDSGGALISDAGGIGVTGGGVGNDAVSVSGTGSVWSNRNDLTIGYGFIDGQRSQNNNNSLTISDGGAVYDNNSFVGGHNNAVVVMGNGSAWNNSGTVIVGVDYFEGGHSLIIADGGVMSDDTAVFAGGSGSKALVVGPGSVWSNRNDLTLGGEGGHSLVISNGGAVYDVNGEVGGFNKVLVTGIGSVWSNSNSLVVGYQNSVIISNGGALYSASGDLNDNPGHMLVTGVGSVWRIGGSLEVAGDQNLTIADEGVVSAGSVSNKAFITVSGGGLYVTNGLGTGALTLYGGGRLTLNSGTVNVDSLASGQGSTIGFNGSTLRTKATTIDNGSTFTVGDGASSAMLKLDSGGSGFHSFANGLTISSNATLRGNGTIIGSTVVNGGGVLAPGASPGSITFSNSLTLAPNSTFAVELNGPTDGQYDRIVTLGTVSVSNSVLSLSLGFAPSVGDTFTIRERHRQGGGRADPARLERPRRRAIRRGQLRRDPGNAARERAVRAREGRIHRRERHASRTSRAGRRRQLLPRRDRGDAARPPGEAVAGPRGTALRAGERHAHHRHRRAVDRRHQPRHRRAARDGRPPRGPVSSWPVEMGRVRAS